MSDDNNHPLLQKQIAAAGTRSNCAPTDHEADLRTHTMDKRGGALSCHPRGPGSTSKTGSIERHQGLAAGPWQANEASWKHVTSDHIVKHDPKFPGPDPRSGTE